MPSLLGLAVLGLTFVSLISATILDNGQVRITNFKDTKINIEAHSLKTYLPNATAISWQGRWDSKHVSWWS